MEKTPAATDFFSQIGFGNLFQALLVLAVVWVVVRLATGFLERLGARFPARRLLIHQLSSTVRFLIWTVGVALAVVALDLSKEFMLTLTGAAAVTIGFALKDIAASVIAGIIIIVDRPFQVGDRISFGGFYGDVKEIGLRSVRLVTLDDNLVTIPNNKFLTDLSSSGNAGALDMMVPCDFWIAVDQDVVAARKLVERCLVANPYVYTGKPWSVLVAQVAQPEYVAYRIRAKAYVLDTRYEKLFETDLTERVHEVFREAGVRAPLAGAGARA